MHACARCNHPFEARADARFCSSACRSASARELSAARMAAAESLLIRQTRAILDGAPAEVLVEITAEAEQLLGDTFTRRRGGRRPASGTRPTRE